MRLIKLMFEKESLYTIPCPSPKFGEGRNENFHAKVKVPGGRGI